MAQALITLAMMVAAVKTYALEHYETSAWDTIVECYADDEIGIIIEQANAKTEEQAIEAVRKDIAPYASYREDIQNTAF